MRPASLGGVALLICLGSAAAGAHSASDAYLTLDAVATGAAAERSASAERSAAAPRSAARATGAAGAILVAHGQWDIALRDLDFVLKLDDDGDGRITWGELKRHQAQIARYAAPQLSFTGGVGDRCSVRVTRQEVDGHADGAYSALFFDVLCARRPAVLHMSYKLFFAIDPSHRGIFVLHAGDDVATAVLAPENATIKLPL